MRHPRLTPVRFFKTSTTLLPCPTFLSLSSESNTSLVLWSNKVVSLVYVNPSPSDGFTVVVLNTEG